MAEPGPFSSSSGLGTRLPAGRLSIIIMTNGWKPGKRFVLSWSNFISIQTNSCIRLHGKLRSQHLFLVEIILYSQIALESMWLPIDLMHLTSSPHVNKRVTNSGQKSAYHEWQNDRGLGSLSTAKQFAKSFLTSAGSDFTLTLRMYKASTGCNSHRSE